MGNIRRKSWGQLGGPTGARVGPERVPRNRFRTGKLTRLEKARWNLTTIVGEVERTPKLEPEMRKLRKGGPRSGLRPTRTALSPPWLSAVLEGPVFVFPLFILSSPNYPKSRVR